MEEIERRQAERRQDHETSRQLMEAAALDAAFGHDAAKRFLELRGLADLAARENLLATYDRRRSHRRAIHL
jgi:hypothetical protein